MSIYRNNSYKPFTSKLPSAGTTIFSVMSALANKYHAINLSQGFPEFPVSEELVDLVHHYMMTGKNQYAPMQGLLKLRERIAHKTEVQYRRKPDPEKEITITAGATEALYAAIATLISAGDEVIVLEPAYDSYIPAVVVNGGVPVPVHLNPDFSVNWQAVAERITAKTKLIIINSPHNPTGAVLSTEDIAKLAEITRDNQILVLSDEVYEHIIFDALAHQSVLTSEELYQRSIIVCSFGKTFHATGWKVGYCIAPAWLTKEIRKVHQYLQFSVHTPTQFALADYLTDERHYKGLSAFYQKKRDLFLQRMQSSPFEPIPAKGTYFQLFSYSNFSKQPDVAFAKHLTREAGVASIPISAFYQDKTDRQILRFCFAKNDETLIKAANLLTKLSL